MDKGARAYLPRFSAVLPGMAASAMLAACKTGTAPVPGAPVVTIKMDSTVPAGDSIHMEAIATGGNDLVELDVYVYDTAGETGAVIPIGGGYAGKVARLTAKIIYPVAKTPPGGYIVFSAAAANSFNQVAAVRDSARVTP